MSWDDGYVTEIQYTYGFYRELTPALLSFAQLAKGLRAAIPGQRLTYCELGCGQGYSTNLHAAANPDIDFHANDFNPGQIAGARRLAADAGSSNVHFYEHSFADLHREPALPESFDFITLHGIYSWISDENRGHILDFIRTRLKPGGLVYVSYNTLPGWATAMPLRRLLVDRSAAVSGPITDRIESALAFIQKMRDAKGVYFTQNPTFDSRFDKLGKASRGYIAHEYLNSAWSPEYFADVAAHFRGAKTDYIGSAHILDHIDGINLSPEMEALLAEEKDAISRESLRDFLVNQEFRRDIFAKGSEQHTPLTMREAWGATRLALSTPRKNVPMKVNGRRGEITLKDDVYAPILDALTGGPQTVAQLLSRPEISAMGGNAFQQAVLVLVGIGQVQPCLSAEKDKQRSRTTKAFNNAIIKRAESSSELSWLASPVTGGGVTVDRFSQLFISALQQGRADPIEWIWSILDSQGQRIMKDNTPLHTKEENVADLQERLASFNNDRLPVYRQLGLI